MSMNTINDQKSLLRISQDAVSEIAAAAVCETGEAMCSKNNVTVKYYGGAAEINLAVLLKNNARAVACAEMIQDSVKNSIQNMSGITVSRVNVKICGQFQE